MLTLQEVMSTGGEAGTGGSLGDYAKVRSPLLQKRKLQVTVVSQHMRRCGNWTFWTP